MSHSFHLFLLVLFIVSCKWSEPSQTYWIITYYCHSNKIIRKKSFESRLKSMKSLYLLLCLICLHQDLTSYVSAYTITPADSIKDGQNLTSQSETFELGFFSPPNSKNRYLGIWYKKIPVQTVVWVANRDSALNDSSGVLRISTMGNLVILNSTNHTIWSTNSSKTTANPIVEFLESGNLVLRDRNSDEYLWQSFDYPSDTMLPGMKIGWNLKTGFNRYLNSWKSFDDPSHGDFTFGIELTADPEPVMRYGTTKYHRAGPWNGIRYSGSPDLKINPIFRYEVVNNVNEVYYTFQLVNQSVISRLVLKQNGRDGTGERVTWVDQSQRWVLHVPIPRDRCDAYGLCGVDSTCDTNDVPVCQCLKGFKPRSPSDWNELDWSGGCEREIPLDCKGDGFRKFTGVRPPDTALSWMNTSMNLEECKQKCLENCTCVAYTNSDIRAGGSGCVMWFRDLIDIRQLDGAGQDLYIRMAASEIEAEGDSRRQKRVIIVVIITSVVGILLLGCCIGGYIMKRRKGWQLMKIKPNGDQNQKDNLELPVFDLDTISMATNNFSRENKLGEGGFGPVYKGQLADGHEIAAKRLSRKSAQGVDEFKNEVLLISKLQHRNLVRLLGCCIQGEEKMLIYEYMPNKSLDSFIFDRTRSTLLDWQKRFQIILGIARGLLYLHHDSRLRIIHRDLKASNILLDIDMEPKISDFGMARIFGGNQIEANTERVVGTHGYMSPEYAVDGHFSVKSDVFSFGVLVLEILSGKKNRGFYHVDHHLNLLGHAWRLWNEDKALDLIDESIGSTFVEQEVLRCIHTGLLCVQQSTQQRPTMSSVLLMLSSDSILLPQPQPPGFYIERSPVKSKGSFSDKEYSFTASNEVTITLVEGR